MSKVRLVFALLAVLAPNAAFAAQIELHIHDLPSVVTTDNIGFDVHPLIVAFVAGNPENIMFSGSYLSFANFSQTTATSYQFSVSFPLFDDPSFTDMSDILNLNATVTVRDPTCPNHVGIDCAVQVDLSGSFQSDLTNSGLLIPTTALPNLEPTALGYSNSNIPNFVAYLDLSTDESPATTVPEPGALLLCASGLVLVARRFLR